MTMHTKAATDDIYEIFNQPLKVARKEDESADDDAYETDDYTAYTSGAESTGTTRNVSTSEVGDEDAVDDEAEDDEDDGSDAKSVSEWSDFTARKHIPDVLGEDTQSSNRVDAVEPEPSILVSEPEDDEEDDEVLTPVSEASLPRTRTSFIPIPPEDYVPPTRPYRDPAEVANNRLPFMTPITERTESSLDIEPGHESIHAKTPCRRDDRGELSETEEENTLDLEALSSPLREVVSDDLPKGRITQPFLQKSTAPASSKLLGAKVAPKGPIIKDAQCNPMDDAIRDEILANMQPSLSSYDGFYDHRDEKCEKGAEIRKCFKSLSKSSRNSTDKTGNFSTAIELQFPDTATQYVIKKELGAGAFAPVYLVENSSHVETEEAHDEEDDAPAAMGRGAFASAHHRRSALEALKMEEPPTPWEFHMMRLAHSRLGPQHRATASLSAALEMHLYQDDGFLLLPYHPHGTLLDVVNLFRAEPTGVMDEQLAMFFSIELFRTVEALHAKQILHGDLKPDNCLLRLDYNQQQQQQHDRNLSPQWSRIGEGGWAARGVTLIDFGRGIDMRNFAPETQFIADWKTTAQDCAEMREGRPWTWQIDYHGLAGTVHCLLFGKYIETSRCDSGGLGTAGGRRYKIREGLKRYWQTEIWAECFDVLLNPGAFVEAEEGARMPVLRSMRRVRERMEECLEASCERGVGLRALMGKVEAWAKGRK